MCFTFFHFPYHSWNNANSLLRFFLFSFPQLPLHGLLTSEEQRRIFTRAPEGVRKIILSTNIAEARAPFTFLSSTNVSSQFFRPSPPRPQTSITVDDCGFVVDCGRMKETRYDPTRRLESLEDVPVSVSNAKQRRGRAGRVQPGVCFHLFTRHTFDVRLDANQAPEMHRVPLEQLVLRIKARPPFIFLSSFFF